MPGQAPYQQQYQAPPAGPGFMNTPETTGEYSQQDINQNKAMAVLAYIGILVLVPIFAAKESKFAKFHANQGLILLIVDVIVAILIMVLSAVILAISWRLYWVSTILSLLYIPLLGFSILGIINAVNGKAKELPLIGKFRLLK
jgi:uncharacterized membrane protein